MIVVLRLLWGWRMRTNWVYALVSINVMTPLVLLTLIFRRSWLALLTSSGFALCTLALMGWCLYAHHAGYLVMTSTAEIRRNWPNILLLALCLGYFVQGAALYLRLAIDRRTEIPAPDESDYQSPVE